MILVVAAVGAALLIVAVVFLKSPSSVHSHPQQDVSGLVGASGIAEESFSSEGKVLVRGELWRATSARGIVQRGEKVVVEDVRPGLLLVVAPLSSGDRASVS